MHHAALDRARDARSRLRSPGRRTLAASGAAACSSARAIRSGTRRSCRPRRSFRRSPGPRFAECPARRTGKAAPQRDELERAADRRQHAQGQHIHLEQPAARRGRPCPTGSRCGPSSPRSRSAPAATACRATMTKPPTCCDRCRGKPISSVASSCPCLVRIDGRRIQPIALRSRAAGLRGRPTTAAPWPTASTMAGSTPEGLADVAQRAARAIGDHHGRRARRAARPYFSVDVLDDFFAPLVLEIDVDVGRLVALPAR